MEWLTEYTPEDYIHLIAPTPLLLIPADHDVLTPTDLTIAAFQKAREPKRLEILPGGHFDMYTEGFDISTGVAKDWFLQHLVG